MERSLGCPQFRQEMDKTQSEEGFGLCIGDEFLRLFPKFQTWVLKWVKIGDAL